jgi:phosphotransferase system HPr (HPr) family protein
MRIEVEIVNELGLHARPAAEFVRCARKFASEIKIHKAGEVFVATSIMEVLTANLDCGARIELEAIGPDADAALEKLAALLLKFRDDEQASG